MKIRMLTHEFLPYQGGVATYAHGLAAAAVEAGHDVGILAPDYGERYPDDPARPYRVRRFSGGMYHNTRFPGLMWRGLNAVLAEPDAVFHAIDWPWAEALHLLSKVRTFEYWATLHGTDVLSTANNAHARYLGVRDPYRSADRLLANSAATLKLYEDRAGKAPAGQSRTVTPLGVEPGWFEPADPSLLSSVLPDLGPDDLLLVSVGRLEPRKGHRLVLQALERLPKALSRRVVYAIAGRDVDDSYVAELKQLAASSPARVELCGTLSQNALRALYHRSDLFTLPGEPSPDRIEGFGLVFLEAAAQETASVATALGGIPEAIAHGSTGLVTEPGSLADFTEALARLLSSPEMRQVYGKAARERAAGFTWDRCAALSYGDAGCDGRHVAD